MTVFRLLDTTATFYLDLSSVRCISSEWSIIVAFCLEEIAVSTSELLLPLHVRCYCVQSPSELHGDADADADVDQLQSLLDETWLRALSQIGPTQEFLSCMQ